VVPSGFVRFSVTSYNFTGIVNTNTNASQCPTNTLTYCAVGGVYLVPNNSAVSQPTISITQINGITVPANPLGQYALPDVQINASTPVTVNLAAANVPLGTQPVLRLTTETSSDLSITCSALAGVLNSSTSTCTATFPFAVSIAAARATW
jgi:hypothetical protein